MKLLLVLAALLGFAASQQGVCNSPYTNINGTCIWFQNTPSLFTSAEKQCESYNGHLVSVKDANFNAFLTARAGQNGINYWLGITCLTAQTCYWTDGTPLNYTNYEPGNPDIGIGNCLYVASNGKWVSAGCANSYFGTVCIGTQGPVIPTVSTPAPNYCPASPFYSDSGFIFSPSYPSNYPPNLRCQYLVTQTDGYVNRIFFSSFVTGAGLDYLQIYDGPSTNSPLIGMLTGNQTGQEIYSSGSTVTMLFRSTTSYQYPGFAIYYESYIPPNSNFTKPPTAPPLTDQPSNATTSSPPSLRPCENQIDADSAGGYIVSPGFDFGLPQRAEYPSNANCSTLITTRSGSVINVRVENVDTEEDFDILTIYDGNSTNGRLLASLSGTPDLTNATLRSSGSSVYLNFASDDSFESYGWTLRFWTTYAGTFAGCPLGWTRDPNDSRCYRFLWGYGLNYTSYAQQCTQTYGGQLASIHNDNQRDFIYSFLQSQFAVNENIYTLIGLRPNGTSFSWTDRSAYNYNSFASMGTSSSCYAVQSWVSGSPSTRPIFQPKGWVPVNCAASNQYGALCYRASTA